MDVTPWTPCAGQEGQAGPRMLPPGAAEGFAGLYGGPWEKGPFSVLVRPRGLRVTQLLGSHLCYCLGAARDLSRVLCTMGT